MAATSRRSGRMKVRCSRGRRLDSLRRGSRVAMIPGVASAKGVDVADILTVEVDGGIRSGALAIRKGKCIHLAIFAVAPYKCTFSEDLAQGCIIDVVLRGSEGTARGTRVKINCDIPWVYVENWRRSHLGWQEGRRSRILWTVATQATGTKSGGGGALAGTA
jgi:hypothetical protein